jgi:hypothetical protein
MIATQARNMHDLTKNLLPEFGRIGISEETRNGTVLRLPGVVCAELSSPMENVCLFEARDANPFFHLIEAMAMLVGYNSNTLLSYFASNMNNFSDDGLTYNAFYGSRARTTFGDQLLACINMLHKEPNTRRAVVTLVDPADLTKETKDAACNLSMVFSIQDEKVCMTTYNRSNDAIWGYLTGANMVHFPFFQLFVANSLGLELGSWTHVSCNMHVYVWNEKYQKLCDSVRTASRDLINPYDAFGLTWSPLFHRPLRKVFEDQMTFLLTRMESNIRHEKFETAQDPSFYLPFIGRVVVPMFNAFQVYKAHKAGLLDHAAALSDCQFWLDKMPEGNDWCFAAKSWLSKRFKTEKM